MAPSFDSVLSLLCAEDNSVFDDNEQYLNHDQDQSFNGGALFPLPSGECLGSMLEKECLYVLNGDYLNRLRSGDLDLKARNEAVDWILKVHAHFGFGPLCAYVSVNYLDRFLSAYELPKGKAWMMQLLAVACLSLAAKVEEAEVPLSLDLQVGESRFVFEARTIQRMELLVLSTLNWRMQAVTPFSFLDYFQSKINGCDQTTLEATILTSIHLMSRTTGEIDLLEFKPSEIAASVAILSVEESQKVGSEIAMSALAQYVDKGRVLKCIELIHELSRGVKGPRGAVSLVAPESPVGVLDAEPCLSYRSDDTTATMSCPNSSHSTPDTKRRRLNRPCELEPLKLGFCVEGE